MDFVDGRNKQILIKVHWNRSCSQDKHDLTKIFPFITAEKYLHGQWKQPAKPLPTTSKCKYFYCRIITCISLIINSVNDKKVNYHATSIVKKVIDRQTDR